MANVFEKPEKFAATALEVLKREIKGAGLFVHKFGRADFVGAKDDTINIKRPPVLKAYDAGFRSRNARVISDIVNSSIKVSLSRFPTSEVALTPEEETLDDVDYVRDVQAPQVRALVEDFDDSIADALGAAKFIFEVTFNPASADVMQKDPARVSRRAKRYLDSKNVPAGGRYWLVGAAVSEAIAGDERLLDVDRSGIPEALRDGVVGRLSGFTIIDWPALSDTESYFVHNTAVAVAAVAPVVPNGAKAGASITAEGLAVTQIWDYDPADKSDHSTVHAFTGTGLVTDPVIENNEFVLKNGKPTFEFVRAVNCIFIDAGVTDSASLNGKETWALTAPGSGTYTVSVDGTATAAIAFDATNKDIQAAINAIEGVDGAKVTGTGSPKTVTFTERVKLTASGATVA